MLFSLHTALGSSLSRADSAPFTAHMLVISHKIFKWAIFMMTTFDYRVFSHDITAAILVSQNNETVAMFVSQTSPVGVVPFSHANAFFCSNAFA